MPDHARRSRRPGARSGVPVLLFGLAAALWLASLQPALAQTDPLPDEQPGVSPEQARIDAARETLLDPNAPPDARRGAAGALLTSDAPSVQAMLHRATMNDHPPGVRQAIADAVSAMPAPPGFIEPALASGVEDATPEQLVWLLPALRTFQTKPTVASVVALLRRDPALPDTALKLVYRTLTDETGQSFADAPDRTNAWLDWWARHENDRATDWYRAIAAAQAGRARTTATDRDRLSADVERLYREVHALTPVGERSPLIADLIRSDRRLLASIGFDLARRALLNARPLGPEVVDAAIARLTDPDVAVRRDAANLLDRIDPPDLGPRVAQALRTEADPEVAGAFLRILSRQPQPGADEATVKWAESTGPARTPALAAAVALLAKGDLESPDEIEALRLVALSEVDTGAPTVPAVRFLAATGHIDQCLDLLSAENREVALVAADAVAASPTLYPRLIEVARTHPDLYAPATNAIRANDPTAAGLATLLALPAPTPEDRLAAAGRVASAMTPTQLLRATDSIKDDALLCACLSHVGAGEFMSRPDDPGVRRDLLLRLLGARLDEDDPEGVLQALTSIQDQVDTAPYASLRVAALLRLGRLDAAADAPGAADVPVSVWLDALDHAKGEPFAPELARRIETRFEGKLTPEQTDRLAQITSALPPATVEEGAPTEPAPDTAEPSSLSESPG